MKVNGNFSCRRYRAVVANINAPAGTAANTGVTLTFTLPAGSTYDAAELAAGVGGVAVPVANTNGLLFGPLTLATANTVTCSLFNQINAAVNSVNATFDLYLFDPTVQAQSTAVTGAQS